MSPSFSPTMIQHVNFTVPVGSLDSAREFYCDIIGFGSDPVPHLQKDSLLWLRIGHGPQQIHVAYEREPDYPTPWPISSKHACFSLPSGEALLELQTRIYEHKVKGGKAAAIKCDQPGKVNSGIQGVEYPQRFFARDYAGNGLEFSAPKHQASG